MWRNFNTLLSEEVRSEVDQLPYRLDQQARVDNGRLARSLYEVSVDSYAVYADEGLLCHGSRRRTKSSAV